MVEGCGRSGVMVAHAIVRPLKGAVPLRIFNPGEEAMMVKKGVTIATMEQLVEEPKTMTFVSSVTAARKPEASLQDQSLLWDMVMKVGKNISMAEKRTVVFGFVGVRGRFLSAARGAWTHDCTSAPDRYWNFTPNPSAPKADSTVAQRGGPVTHR